MPSELKANALTTLARVKAILEITNTSFDNLLERYINAVSDFIEGETNTVFKQATYSDEKISVYSERAEFVFLKHAPVVSVTNLKYRAGTPAAPNYTAFTTDQYELAGDGKSGMIRIYGCAPKGTNVLTCTYVAGYLIDWANTTDLTKHTLPADITSLCEQLVVKAYKKKVAKGKSSETGASGDNVNWKSSLDDEDTMILNRYARQPQFI